MAATLQRLHVQLMGLSACWSTLPPHIILDIGFVNYRKNNFAVIAI